MTRIRIPDYRGRETFEFILNQIEDCLEDIKPLFDAVEAEQLYNKRYLIECTKILKEREGINLIQMAMCDIAYSIVFFGLSHKDLTTFMRLYIDNYNNTFLRYLTFYLAKKPHPDFSHQGNWVEFKRNYFTEFMDAFRRDMTGVGNSGTALDVFIASKKDVFQEKYPVKPFKFYGGHQFKLGHYYRHLYQTVKFIDRQDVFCYREKYEYAKTLRAQLSTPEQYLLFFNSLSKSGRAWEFAQISVEPSYENANYYLITKYNFIKNLPDLFFKDMINIQSFYPELNFEFRIKSELREKLEEKFS